MLVRREAILFALESSYRTAATPGISDAVFVENISFSSDSKSLERKGPKDTLGTRQPIYGGRTDTISFDIELKGSGTEGVAPEFGDILQVCGIEEVIVADTSVTYKPKTYISGSPMPSGTLYYYQDGKRRAMIGIRGEAKLTAAAREYAKINVTLHGHPVAVVDAAMVDPTYSNVLPEQFVNASFLIDSFAAEITKLELDLGNQIVKPDSVRAANGIGEIRITGRDVKGMIDPEEVLNASYNFYSKWESNATASLDSGVVGATAGNRWQITAPAVHFRDLSQGDRDGLRTIDANLGFAESSGDDEFSLIFT